MQVEEGGSGNTNGGGTKAKSMTLVVDMGTTMMCSRRGVLCPWLMISK